MAKTSFDQQTIYRGNMIYQKITQSTLLPKNQALLLRSQTTPRLNPLSSFSFPLRRESLLIDIPWPALHMGLDPDADSTSKAIAVGGSPAISAKLRRSDGGTLWGFWPQGPRLWLCAPEDERQEVRIPDSRHPKGSPLAQVRL